MTAGKPTVLAALVRSEGCLMTALSGVGRPASFMTCRVFCRPEPPVCQHLIVMDIRCCVCMQLNAEPMSNFHCMARINTAALRGHACECCRLKVC